MRNMTRRAFAGIAAIMVAFGATELSAAAETTLERIKSEGKITVGIDNSQPWGFRDANGQVAGFSPDLISAALGPLGVKKIDFVISEFPALISSLQSGRFDAIAAGMWITPVRCKAVAFSDPDLVEKDALLVMKGNPLNIHSYADVAGNPELRLAADRGSAAIEHAIAAGVPKDRMLQLTDFNAAVAALTGGRVEGVPMASSSIGRLLRDPNVKDSIDRAMPFTGYIAKDGIEAGGASAIGFRLADTDLRDAYNKRLAEMKADGTVDAIKKKYGIEIDVASVTAEQACSEE
ncbi:MAG: ectoine/hydroxyectoine ABC transporter substrate-binding protein EhuB [Mesorhizobium sp.]|uniref:ectoine/hydroxyectoine ABC transporter substrate-binding protein EhuB n=1 Tax=Mesorhizobium sp. TaxID=1871066 RepID=UPI000FEA27B7|nr:ectoine/hydroxyectoine ABC transporter substrate-binding protein EhuB [Mesorhizobium sp.]RWE05702.1 MAG: ectoine/hydroxyectoine ABC transporter substrate-binding protein EhuB [Mesorhizobium sp.]